MTSGVADFGHVPPLPGGQSRRWTDYLPSGMTLLLLPPVLFVLLFFVGPILLMLSRSVYDPEIVDALPRSVIAIGKWDRTGLPDATVKRALVEDLQAAPADAVGRAARRLNSFRPGFNSLLTKTKQSIDDAPEAAAGQAVQLEEIDPRWTDASYWAALANNTSSLTDAYLLAAIDKKRNTQGEIVSVESSQRIYWSIIGRTLMISLVTTIICLVLAFPLAYGIVAAGPRLKLTLLAFVLLPFWTSLLVRSVAWVVLLQREGLVTATVRIFDPDFAGLALVHNRAGVYIAMVHTLLPFAVLPLYAVMGNIPRSLAQASFSLGARPARTFFRVYLPQAAPGLYASGLLVFISAIGYYITPALVGGGQDQLLSYYIATFVNATVNWGMAAALSIVLILLIVVLLLAFYPLMRRSGRAL